MIDNSYIKLEDEQVLRGVTTDSNLSFENRILIVLQESKPKIKCPYKNYSLNEYTEAKNNHEIFCNFLIYLLLVTP